MGEGRWERNGKPDVVKGSAEGISLSGDSSVTFTLARPLAAGLSVHVHVSETLTPEVRVRSSLELPIPTQGELPLSLWLLPVLVLGAE